MEDKIILIVEDEDTNVLYLESLLAINNFKYRIAKDGQTAVDMCKNEQIDLVLMDIKLPVKSGIVATKEIKQFNKDIPIIAQTAYALSGDKEKIIDAGCDDYISKPIDKDVLLEKINKLMTVSQ